MKNDERILKLGLKIRFERMKRGLSQEQLAEKAGLSMRSLSIIECGQNNPRYTTLLAIANAFDIDITELLNFTL